MGVIKDIFKLFKFGVRTTTKAVKLAEKASRSMHRKKTLSTITDLKQSCLNYTQIADQLNNQGVSTISGKGIWRASTVSRLLKNK
ncbi:MAG: recombinase family protein [Proteobacteria bacterium]|nr:recombinase family protein [Pseudomonadota bacterium]MBU4259446.1 recombinase family protein [Pseudomonadota bacterium]MBU4289028.1 recombinase family protein [Pseudomonadota bacterium]MBU4414485.1 recombinase family protein [Pseudomonadota bacterium]MCG2758199.1 recombinase family protein [Desulfobacteraceae bacterium]